MKILFVIPPSPFLLDEKSLPHLGILSIATLLKKTRKHSVNVLDLSGIENYVDAFSYILKHHTFDIIGFTSSTPQYPHVNQLLKLIPEGVKKIIGGPHITSCFSPKHTNSRIEKNISDITTKFDTAFVGDSEISILKYIDEELFNERVLNADTDPKLFLTNNTINDYPWADRTLIDIDSYHFYVDGSLCTSIISQLGCPFNCSFCCGRASNSLRKIRIKSVDNVVREIEHLYKTFGFQAFMFYDDELNVSKNANVLLKELIDFQRKFDVKFKFRGFVKSELFTDEQAYLMKQCGFNWLLSGFEAASDRILVNINKKSTKKDNENVVKLCKKNDIKIKALMSCGHPGETKESVLDIKSWVINNKVDDLDVTIITPYPGSPYYDLSTHVEGNTWKYTVPSTGDNLYSENIKYSDISNFYKGIRGSYKSYVHTDYITAEDLVKYRDIVDYDSKAALNISYNVGTPTIKLQFTPEEPHSILK